jgi:multiple sugar transport system substrate-binding protein
MFPSLRTAIAVGVAALMMSAPAVCAEPVQITVAIPIVNTQKVMQEKLAARFMEERPDIKVKLDASGGNYDAILQMTLRAAITGGLPDVSYYPYNRMPLLVERGIPIQLDRFIAQEPDWEKKGYLGSVLDLGRLNGKVYGLPFNTSTTVIYYNADLVRKAGGNPDKLPQTWGEVTSLAAKIKALGGNHQGMYYDYYDTTGNWTFIALVESMCGRMMSADNGEITFDRPAGMRALKVLQEIGQAGMVDMSKSQARQAFSAGTLGIFVVSTSYLEELTKAAKGHFDLRVGPFPVPCEAGRLPAGGNAAVMLTKDPAKQAAAWEWIKFITGPVGQAIAVKGTGYMSTNTIAIERADLLGDFYREHPAYMVSVAQLPRMTGFFAFPGPNSVKISDVIRNYLREVITLQRTPEQVMPDMADRVKKLLPSS